MIYCFDVIDSTNKYIKENFQNMEDFSLVIAKHQTNGRGRIDRIWYDNSNTLTASVLIKNVERNLKDLSLISALALFNVLRKYDLDVSVKWPNDIYVNDKKICGILIETIISESTTAIIGFGVNTNINEFPDELNATSIQLEKNTITNNEKLAEEIAKEIKRIYDEMSLKQIVEVLRNHSYLMFKKVYMNYYGEDMHGTVLDLIDNGNILLDVNGYRLEVFSGELELIK